MNIIFLSGLFPKQMRNEIESKSTGVIQYAADALQWATVDGFDYFCQKNFRLVNLPYIGSFPKRYKDFRLNTFSFSHKYESNDVNVGFVNLPLYKLYSRFCNAKKVLNIILQDDNEIILIYAVHTPFIKAAVDLKVKNPSLKICLIVPDLPKFMGGDQGFFNNLLKRIEQSLLKKLLNHIDAFVLLSKYMHEPLEVGSRPWVRVEGIFSSAKNIEIVEKESCKTILYTGTLDKRYGILNLLKAFAMIKDEKYRLWICGDGDAKVELYKMVKSDSRITNFGQIPREEILSLQKKATVLVNPRTSEGEYTKYSFPSKTMEYLASGTPSILHRLEGIPEEYFDYCFVAEEETPFGLYQMMVSVCEKDEKELRILGEKAKNFILDNKSPEKQCEKIYNMLIKLYL